MNVYDQPVDVGVKRMIHIDCPGVMEDDVTWEEMPNGVKISDSVPCGHGLRPMRHRQEAAHPRALRAAHRAH